MGQLDNFIREHFPLNGKNLCHDERLRDLVREALELAAQEAEKEASFHWTCAGEVSCPESDVADAIAARIRKLKE